MHGMQTFHSLLVPSQFADRFVWCCPDTAWICSAGRRPGHKGQNFLFQVRIVTFRGMAPILLALSVSSEAETFNNGVPKG